MSDDDLTSRRKAVVFGVVRRSLLPDPTVADSVRAGWQAELRKLELIGIR